MHLRPDELVDIAEGARAEASLPHLAVCDVCRHQVAELKAMISAAAGIEAPEPSPLFWDHFSARVRDAVAAEGAPRRSFWSWPRVLVPAAALGVAGFLLVMSLNTNRAVSPPPAPVARNPMVPVPVELLADPQLTSDDTALNLVAELSSDMDFDAAREAGLAVGGGAEHAVTHMDGGELRELRRLLQEELAHSGA